MLLQGCLWTVSCCIFWMHSLAFIAARRCSLHMDVLQLDAIEWEWWRPSQHRSYFSLRGNSDQPGLFISLNLFQSCASLQYSTL